MRRIINCFLVVILLIIFSNCSNNHCNRMMIRADSLMDANQDSARAALVMLDKLKPQYQDMSKKEQMQYELTYAKGMNKGFVKFSTDSVMKLVVDYYDGHGTSNEKMLAHYLLGCAYRDLSDSPVALDCYNKAVECADTNRVDCNMALLARIHSAMGVLFENEQSPLMMINEEKLAAKYAWQVKDTLTAIWSYKQQMSGYALLNNIDSVLSIGLSVYSFCEKNGLEPYKYDSLNPIIDAYLKRKDYAKAGYYLRIFQQSPDYFVTPEQPRRGSELLYYTLGRYYCAIGKVDDAIVCFRKILTADNITFAHLEAAYGGLHSAYQLKGISDSISKYAQLFVNANDSSHVHGAIESMNKIQAMYNYQNYKQQVLKVKEENLYLWIWIICGVATVLILALGVFLYIKKKIKNEKIKMFKANGQYNKILSEYKCSIIDLGKIQTDFSKYKIEKENEISQLKQSLATYGESYTEEKRSLPEQVLLNDILVSYFHLQAQQIKVVITDTNWQDLENLVKKHLPKFINLLSSKDLPDKERRAAILAKLHFIPSEMSVLLGVSAQRMTNIRANINLKLFKCEGAKSLDANLIRLT